MYQKKLLELGISADIKGFYYLNYAITIYKPGQSIILLYKQIAAEWDTTASRVERSIRHAISKTGDNIHSGAFIAKYKILWRDEVNAS